MVVNPLCQWSFMAMKTTKSHSEDRSVQNILTLLVPRIFTFLESAAVKAPQPFPLSYDFLPNVLLFVTVPQKPKF